ncbi:esterase/lipase family protein [Aquabacterium sp.]|uniref:esterase/lipase family protein n=1 Tax=Aquabacterium sp. TaxID=1872578 RepID=UPI0035AE21A6
MVKQALKTAVAVAAGTLMLMGAAHAGTYAQTKYPIVLAHGMAGFSSIAGIDYFYGVPQDLRSNGATVYSTSVSAFNSAVLRGEQLLTQVEDISAISGAKKFNLVGHSQGNQSIRYVAAVRPDLVASVTSVGGVTFGSPVADLIQGLSGLVGPTVSNLIASVVNALGSVEALLSGNSSLPQDSLEGTLPSLTTSGAAAFNAAYPAGVPTTSCGQGAAVVNGIRYYSWSGTGQVYNVLDPADYILKVTAAVLPEASDGLVGKCASHLGVVLRDNYPMNHLHEVNQLLGLVGLGADPVGLYRIQANRLKKLGL